MSRTVYGILADELGLASTKTLEQGALRPELRRRVWATPAAHVRDEQGTSIPVDRDHDGQPCGEVVHLQRIGPNLWCVAHIDESVTPTVNVKVGDTTVTTEQNLYWSASRLSTPDYRDIVIDSVSLTAHPCRVGATPVRFLDGQLDHRAAPRRWQLDRLSRGLLTRAAHVHLDRRARGRNVPLIVDDGDLDGRDTGHVTGAEKYIAATLSHDMQLEDEHWQSRPLRIRPGGRILSIT